MLGMKCCTVRNPKGHRTMGFDTGQNLTSFELDAVKVGIKGKKEK
jgi:hypothetical protein